MVAVLEFLENNLQIVSAALFSLAGIVLFFVNYLRTGKIDKELTEFINKELEIMKFKTANDTCQIVSQTFSDTIPDYKLNPKTNELERLPIDKNIQAYIDSYIDCALDRILDRFLPAEQPTDQQFVELEQMQLDLAQAGEMFDLAEEYREKFGLSDDLSVSQIFDRVQQESDKLAKDIDVRLKMFEKKEEIKNEEKKETK